MKYGSIAGGDKTTVESALDILKCGGNAFDAAVGAVFTSMVSEFTLTGPGGGGALLACPAGEDPILFDFFVDTPPPQPNKELDFFGILIYLFSNTYRMLIKPKVLLYWPYKKLVDMSNNFITIFFSYFFLDIFKFLIKKFNNITCIQTNHMVMVSII